MGNCGEEWSQSGSVQLAWWCSRKNGVEMSSSFLSTLDLQDPPSLIAVYMREPDKQEHTFGPDSVEVSDAVSRVDSAIGKLLNGLKRRKILEDFAPWGLNITMEWVDFEWYRSVVLGVTPPPGVDPVEVVATMRRPLATERLHYSSSYRVPPIVGLLAEGYEVAVTRASVTDPIECAGDHGYDNKYMSMRTFFFAQGPRFPKGKQVPSFESVQVYNMIASILGIEGTSNNGSLAFANNILIPLSAS